MRETQKRINEYKKALPHMREKVIAVAMLLLIGVTMVVSATFAWVTLSTEPEVNGFYTTISSNGNLEIALSNPLGVQPDETAVGDGQGNVLETNLKWGNLVNLSHESYGLDYLTLRPASLNTAALAVSPLFAVNYAQDGRIEGYQTDFAFSNYNSTAKVFDVHDTTRYGVRAISSVTYSNAHAASFYAAQLETITASMADAKTKFSKVYNNSTYMKTVTALVGIHVSAYMGTDDISCLTHIPTLNKIMVDLEASVEATGQTIVDIANLYLYKELADKGQADTYESLRYDLEDLKASNYSNAFVTKYSKTIKGMNLYVATARTMKQAAGDLELAQQNEDGDVLWKRDLEDVADLLCGISDATLKDKNVTYWSSHKSEAAKLLLSGSVETASLNSGIIRNLDQLLGEPVLRVENVSVPVTLPSDFEISLVAGRTFNLTVNVITNAGKQEPFQIPEAYSEAYIFAQGAASSDRGTPVAADTYAMAIDFWVRTNEQNALLMLEGEVQYHVEYEPVTGMDANGQEVALYAYKKTITDSNNQQQTFDVSVYKVGNQWYNAQTHEPEDVGSATPTAQINEIRTPIGYEGANRVWEELDDPNSDYAQMIQNGTSTTQGSGSCYIFYPETPEDQEQSLHLLESMAVAFVDANGKLLGQARMDTANAIEDAGRVIVPLRMKVQAPIVVGKDAGGNELTENYYVTPLVQNEAKRITAIVYLDGGNLSNDDVLAAGTINGKLNIQFGLNKMENAPLKDSAVMDDYYTLSFSQRTFSFDSYNPDTCKVDLELAVAGTAPQTITGSFISYISATQGARQQEFSMVYDDISKTWKVSVPFSGPGEFKLRSLQLDGVDILLPESQIVTVNITGLRVSSLSCTNWGGDGSSQSIMTAESSYRQEVVLTLGASGGTIPAVQGVFIGENGKNVTVDFATDNGTVYTGYANFSAGGTYKLTYVIIDGVYTPIEVSMYKTLNLTLNLCTTVVLGQPVDQGYYDLLEEKEQAIAGASTSAEKEQIESSYDRQISEYLRVLHYGNGIAGDEKEKGLELSRDSMGNLSFVTDCAEALFIDAYCIISDDQGNTLNGLANVELMYSAGGITNSLDSDMTERADAGYYIGRFTLQSNGVFSFQHVSFTQQGRTYTISKAISAPTVTAIQPAPMEYVQQGPYEELKCQLGMAAENRVLYIKLKNAAAATLDVVLTDAEGNTHAPVQITAGEPDSNNVTTFAVQVPEDGYWRITGVKAKNVFYNGTFYTGLGGEETWLDLSQLAYEDNIATTYITEVEIVVDGDAPKQEYSGGFMADNLASKEADPMTVSVLGYNGAPLEEVLRSVGLDVQVTFSLTYTWDPTTVENYGFRRVDNSANLPQNVFTTTYDEGANMAVMAPMHFRLNGTYAPSWTVRIDDAADVYDYSYSFVVGGEQKIPEMFTCTNTKPIERVLTVIWTAPTVEISGINPNGAHSSAYYYYNKWYDFGYKNANVTSFISTDKHSATVYHKSVKATVGTTLQTHAQATLKLGNRGGATGAKMTFSTTDNSGTVYLYKNSNNNDRTADYEWGTGDTVTRYVGYYDSGTITSITYAGTLEAKSVTLYYGDVQFAYDLDYSIKITNKAAG